MPNTHSTLTSLFSDIADSIRGKTGSSATIVADDFPTAIANIPTGGGGITTTEVANATGTTLEITSGSGGGISDPFTLNHTLTDIGGGLYSYSVPKLQVDSIVLNKPTVLRLEESRAGLSTKYVYGYVLSTGSDGGYCTYLPPYTTSSSNSEVIKVSPSYFKYREHTYSYNSSTDCYEYTESGGSNN